MSGHKFEVVKVMPTKVFEGCCYFDPTAEGGFTVREQWRDEQGRRCTTYWTPDLVTEEEAKRVLEHVAPAEVR